ncbi:hypothetical protein [Anaerosporobacter sp.]|uniref:hypothetical protein n=1 Tax=Anaerosporobacter sp. TaxID=1872529 RepID=UPI00286EE08B|nr:hypothetical protein [Anaerosporobacter sp.]
MKQDTFLILVKQHLENMSKQKMKDCLLDMAEHIPEDKKQDFLQLLQNSLNLNQEESIDASYKPRMSDQLVEEKRNELISWLDGMEEQELYLEADGHEEYLEDYWQSEGDWVWEYSDSMGIGTKLEMAYGFAKDCVNDRRYEAALDILDRILAVEIWVETEWDDMTIGIDDLKAENIVKIDLTELALTTLYAAYLACDKEKRAADLYTYFGYSFFQNIRVEEMRRIGREELPEENAFWDDWIELLSSKEGNLETRLLKEAILFAKGADGLADMARRSYLKHPALYLEALKEYEMNHEYEKMVALGTEAINAIDKKYRIRGDIALKTSFAQYYLGHMEEMKKMWYEVYVSDMSEVNFLRLFLEDEMAIEYGMKGKDISRPVLKGNNFIDNPQELKENLLDKTTDTYMAFLSGEYEKVKKVCVDPANSLGWSGKFIGSGVRIFLLYLYNQECLKKPINKIADEVAYSFRFSKNEEFYFFEKSPAKNGGATETFWMAFCRWRNYFPMSENEKNKYLHWLEEIIDKRTKAIVGGQFRNHYGSVAMLILALGEVKESLGYQNAKQELKEKYKKMFPRHSSFHGAMREYS